MADYRHLPIGMKIKQGEINECPYCQRIGLVQVALGKFFVLHADGLLPDGRDEDIDGDEDACPEPGVPFLSCESEWRLS